jgi:hypothetical protein
MRKIFFISFLLICIGLSKSDAQQKAQSDGTYEYYIVIHGADAKSDVNLLEGKIIKQEGVKTFIANRFPISYFILRSSRPVSNVEFERWVNSSTYRVIAFTQDKAVLEKAIVTNRKNK